MEEKTLSTESTKLENLIKENVVIITNNTNELNIFLEHDLNCFYTSNPLNTVKELEILHNDDSKEFNIKEIYLCLTEADIETTSFYRKFREESFIAGKLRDLGIDAKGIHIDSYKKEMQVPSKFNQTNSELLTEYLNKIKNSYNQKLNDTAMAFIKNRKGLFKQEQYKRLEGKKIQTGFPQLDDMFSGGLEEGVYVLTGGSSVGKTAFVTNLAENIAEQGNYVLYISLEMRESNLISRGISRQMYKNNNKTTVSFKQIENGELYHNDVNEEDLEEYMTAENYYFDNIGEFLTIYQGNLLSTSHVDVYSKAKMIRDMTTKSPVVIVDYLQQMTSATNPDAQKTVIVEQNIAGLKQLSRDLETPVIVISSLSRVDALEGIGLQSFAQTSAIEYTADVCMGLALEVVYSDQFKATSKITEKRLLVNEAIAEPTRMVRLSIVKNRLGVAAKDILMNYIPKNNTYMECLEGFKKEDTSNTPEGFTEVDSSNIPKEFITTNQIEVEFD